MDLVRLVALLSALHEGVVLREVEGVQRGDEVAGQQPLLSLPRFGQRHRPARLSAVQQYESDVYPTC